MAAWQEFWREDGHEAADGFVYKESGPHLMLMAFLQRVVNGGGRIDREYALGRDALDEGWLLIFDRRPEVSWDARIFTRTETVGARRIHVVGC